MSSNRHLKVFKTYDEYNEYIQTQIYRTPSVFIIKENEDDENKEIHYHSHDIIVNNIREYFTIENIGDYELTLYVSPESCGASAYGNLYYCFENSNDWQELGENEITIPINKSVKFKGVLNKGETVGRFNINGNSVCRVYGNIMSLVYGDNFFGKTDLSGYEYVFTSLFYCCYTTLVDASELILPATTLANSCYYNMFSECTSLTTAPQLLATTLKDGCYQNMFCICTSLTSAPQLPATTLADNCYNCMFYGCTSLTTASQLPATTLADSCYNCMFEGCTSLTIAPHLLATTLASWCYSSMFRGCNNLSKITMLATDISATNCLDNWVNGVASEGTFTKHPQMTSLPNGTSGIPNGWTVEDYNE